MIQRQRLFMLHTMAMAALAIAALSDGRSVSGDDRSASAARARAESERKSREIKKKVEDQQREVRQRLNLPDPTGAGPGRAVAKPNPSALPPSFPASADALRKKWNLPDPRGIAKATSPGRKKDAVEYSPRRGQEFAFLVEMSTREGALEKKWIGTPYFAGVFSDVGRSFAEMLCIGNLACRIRSSPDRPWSAASIEDIELPHRFMFGSHGVLNAQTTGLFDQHTLPLQLSALLPLEELIFPSLPTFSDSPRNESKESTTFYMRGGQKNILGYTPTTTLNGEFRRKSIIEQENSSTPQIVNERAFHCPSQGVGLSFRQVGSFDAREGMIVNVDLEYLLELGDEFPLTVKVRRLSGNDLETARADALKKLPPANWPEYFRRLPADRENFGFHQPPSAADMPAGQAVSVSIEISERNAHGSRDYLARTIAGAPEGKVRVRLEGSHEELVVSPSDVRLPK